MRVFMVVVMMMAVIVIMIMVVIVVVVIAFEEFRLDIEDAIEIEGVAA